MIVLEEFLLKIVISNILIQMFTYPKDSVTRHTYLSYYLYAYLNNALDEFIEDNVIDEESNSLSKKLEKERKKQNISVMDQIRMYKHIREFCLLREFGC